MDLTDIKQIKYLLEKHGSNTKKSLGQNFLVNKSVPRKTALLSVSDSSLTDIKSLLGETDFYNEDYYKKNSCITAKSVLEIGVGVGALTAELLRLYDKVVAVEIDTSLTPLISEIFGEADNFNIIFGDIMKTDIKALLCDNFADEKIDVCANLPYYITTPVICKLLEHSANLNSITVMVQREAADKICAAKGTENYGFISALAAYYGEAKRYFNIPPSYFYPAPKVTSSVIKIDIYKEQPYKPKDEKIFLDILRFVFDQRRKTLVNVLSSKYNISKKSLTRFIADTTGDANIRGEMLGVPEFTLISDYICGEPE